MYIVLFTSNNHAMMLALKAALKERYKSIVFNLRSNDKTPTEYSILLEGVSCEDKPVAFSQGFAAAWKD
jgi:hypothetical protein